MTPFPTHHVWRNLTQQYRRVYQCGHCGAITGSNFGYSTEQSPPATIYICGACNQPTYFFESRQIPAPLLGNPVDKLPTEIKQLYEEARKCTSLEAYTACVLCCRKILMHIAVDKGAEQNLSFLKYVEYLDDNHFTPPNSKTWVDHIRTKGNEANHEIIIMPKEEAQKLLAFSEMLLKFIYEFPKLVSSTTP